jgi:hypothetical protein
MAAFLHYLSIGDLSRATHVTVKAPRHYHQIGLLEPAEVAPDISYRRYNTSQIPVAQVISRLRRPPRSRGQRPHQGGLPARHPPTARSGGPKSAGRSSAPSPERSGAAVLDLAAQDHGAGRRQLAQVAAGVGVVDDGVGGRAFG